MANMQNKKMQLNVNCNKEINIDKNAIKQLIIILLDNALKYTEENFKSQQRHDLFCHVFVKFLLLRLCLLVYYELVL